MRVLRIVFLFLTLSLPVFVGCSISSSKKPTLIGKLQIPFLKSDGGKSLTSILYVETLASSSGGREFALLLFPSRFQAQLLIMDRKGEEVASRYFKERFVDILALAQLMPFGNRTASLLSWDMENDKLMISLNRLEREGSIGTNEVHILNPDGSDIMQMENFTTIGLHQQWSTKEGVILLKRVDKDSSHLFDVSGKQLSKENVDLLVDEYKRGKVSLVLQNLAKPSVFKVVPVRNLHISIGDLVLRRGEEIYVLEQGLKGKIRIWKLTLEKGEELQKEFKFPQDHKCEGLPSPNLEYLAVLCYNLSADEPQSFLEVIRTRDGKTEWEFRGSKNKGAIFPLAWAPDGKRIALLKRWQEDAENLGKTKESLLLWDIENKKEQEIPIEKGQLVALSWMDRPDGGLFFLTRTPEECFIFFLAL